MPTFAHAALEDCPGNLLGCYVPPISTSCTPTLNAFSYNNGVPVLDPSPSIEYGESVLLYWSGGIFSVNDTKSIINYGPVGPSYLGSVTVTPTQTTTYTLRCDWTRTSYLGTTGGTAYSTPRTVTVSNPPVSGSCSASPTSIQTGQSSTWTANPSGGTGTYTYSWSGTNSLSGTTQSVSKTYASTGTKTASVTITSGGNSTTAQCSNSVSVSAPAAQCANGIDDDGDGFIDSADYGCYSGGGTYNSSDTSESPNPQCADGIDNNGNGLLDYPDDSACSSYTDGNEEVLDAEISLSASPSLVQPGGTTTLEWTAENIQADSCSLAGTNGDSWALTGSGGSQTSSALDTQTIFTLSCIDGADDPISTATTIRLTPSFQEI